MSSIASKTIVFITGAYVSHHCWDNWKQFFEAAGYKTLTPAWPGKEAEPSVLREMHPDRLPKLASLTLKQLIDHHADILKGLPEKPIVIGHSFGGMIAQVMLNRDLAQACVSIHGVPPSNVMPYEWNFLKSNFKTLGYFTPIKKSYMMSFRTWQFAFTNGMSFEEQKLSYEAICIPESKQVTRGGLSTASKIDMKKAHGPLLMLAGSSDQCIPEHLCNRNFKAYRSNGSVTDYFVKPRNHYVLGLPTWREDAVFIQEWLKGH